MQIIFDTARTAELSCVGKRSDYKKMDEIANNDLDAGCRKIINTSTPARRRLRNKLRRQARKRLSRIQINDDGITWIVSDGDVVSVMKTHGPNLYVVVEDRSEWRNSDERETR